MKTVSQQWKLLAASGAQPVVRIRIAPTGWSNVATTGQDFYSGDKYDPLWGGYNPQMGIVDTGDINESIDPITRKASTSGFSFDVLRHVWMPLLNSYKIKSMPLLVSLGFKGLNEFVDLWRGLVRDFKVTGKIIHIECTEAKRKFDTIKDYSIVGFAPAHPAYWLSQFCTDILDSAEYDITSLTYDKFPDTQHHTVNINNIALEAKPQQSSISEMVLTIPGNVPNDYKQLELGPAVDHLCELILGSFVLRSGVLTLVQYTPTPTIVGILSDRESTIKHKSSTEYLRNYGVFKACNGSISSLNLNTYLCQEIYDATGPDIYPKELLEFSSDWVNGGGLIANSIPASLAPYSPSLSNQVGLTNLVDNGDNLVFYGTIPPRSVNELLPNPVTLVGPLGPYTTYNPKLDAFVLSGIAGIGFLRNDPPTALVAVPGFNLDPTVISGVKARLPALFRVFDGEGIILNNYTEVISIDMWAGDANDFIGFTNPSHKLAVTSGQNGAGYYTLNDIYRMYPSGAYSPPWNIWGRINERGLKGTTKRHWNTYTLYPVAIDVTIAHWWLETNINRLRHGIPIAEITSPITTIELELLDAIRVESENIVFYERDGVSDDTWEILKTNFNPLKGTIKRTVGMITDQKVNDAPGYTPRWGTDLDLGYNDNPIFTTSNTALISMSEGSSGTKALLDGSKHLDKTGILETDIIISEDDSKKFFIKLRSKVFIDSGGAVSLFNTSVIESTNAGFGTPPSIDIIENGGATGLDISYSNLSSSVMTKWIIDTKFIRG